MEKYTKLSKKSILILVLLLIVVCLALIVFDFFGRVKHYSFGEEIRAFPIEQTAVIFTEWKITNTFHGDDAGEGSVFVVINYTVRNIGDTELSLSEFRSAQTPILKYGNYYAEARHIPVWIPLPSPGGEKLWYLYDENLVSLMPNQSTRGFIYYKILEGYEPEKLLHPNKDSPTIIIDFKR